jgi:hypothetical protein
MQGRRHTILTTATETKPTPTLESLEPLIERVQTVSSLNTNEAKTVVFWAIATYGLPKLDTFPILVFRGPPGTGKSTLLDVVAELSHKPCRLDGKVTKAVLRDSFAPNTTAIVEEANRVYEPLILARYSKRTSGTSVNRKAPDEWKREGLDLFGATALHRHTVPFRDPAVASRSIEIKTRRVTNVARYQAEGNLAQAGHEATAAGGHPRAVGGQLRAVAHRGGPAPRERP